MGKKIIVSYGQRTKLDDTPEHYTVKLPEPIKRIKKVSLASGNVPKSSYPIIKGYNDSFDFLYGGDTKTVTLTPQHYDGFQLATEIETQIRSVFSTTDVTVTFNERTGKLKIESFTLTHSWLSTVNNSRVKALVGATNTFVTGLPNVLTEFPNKVLLGFPGFILLDVTTNYSLSKDAVRSPVGSHSYAVLNDGKGQDETIVFEELSEYVLSDQSSNKDIDTITLDFKIRVLPEDAKRIGSSTATEFPAVNIGEGEIFNGLGNTLLLDVE